MSPEFHSGGTPLQYLFLTPMCTADGQHARYTLSMTLEVEGHVAPDSSRIVELVTSRVPGACCLRSAAAELVVRLPMDASASFADMLDELEANRAQLGLGHYAISSPTLVSSAARLALYQLLFVPAAPLWLATSPPFSYAGGSVSPCK